MKKKPASKSAFFNSRVLLGVAFCATGSLLALLSFGLSPGQAALAQAQVEPPTRGQYRGLLPVVHFDVSPALRDMTPIAPTPRRHREDEESDIERPKVTFPFSFEPDPVVQSSKGSIVQIPLPIVSFDGQPNIPGGGAPP